MYAWTSLIEDTKNKRITLGLVPVVNLSSDKEKKSIKQLKKMIANRIECKFNACYHTEVAHCSTTNLHSK